MKTLLFILAVLIIAVKLMNYAFAGVDLCPAGSYPISTGELVCKEEPTGCAYGDSIPLDSPKCAPAEEAVITTYAPVENDEKIIGK